MTVTEMLLKTDSKKVDELNEGTYESKALARALGKEGTVTIKIREISARRMNEYNDGVIDMSGNISLMKGYEAGKRIIVAGVVDPDLKDKGLQEHFGCKLAVDLAEKLFKNEILDLSSKIQALSGVTEADEDEIKN